MKKNKIKKIKKVVIPVAGWGTRFLPYTKIVPKELLPVLNKPILHHLISECVESKIEEVILVISDEKKFLTNYFSVNKDLTKLLKEKKRLSFLKEVNKISKSIKISTIIQKEKLGLGHAILMTKKLVGDEPFGVILGDDLISSKKPAIKQLIDSYNEKGVSIIGVQQIAEKNLHKYGVVQPVNKITNTCFEINGAKEKPKKLSEAPSKFAILGRYVFTPLLFKYLSRLKIEKGIEINVVDVFSKLHEQEGLNAFVFEGQRYDLGSVEGFVKANIDFALNDPAIKESIKKFIKEKTL